MAGDTSSLEPKIARNERIPLRAEAEQVLELAEFLANRIDRSAIALPITFRLPDMAGTVTVSGTYHTRKIEIEFQEASD